jgi:Calx-beta domain
LNSTPNTTFQVDFYTSAALDPSGNGEGAQFLGTTPATTNGNGNATINVSFPVALGTGRVVTATATDPNGHTSEFSAGDINAASGNLQFSVSVIQINEDLGLLTLTVLRKGGSTGSVSVDFVTIDGEAMAGQDYTATSGTLTFNAGETSKNIQIPILDDAVSELFETFTVALRNASSVEALGTPRSVAVTLWDHSAAPIITQQGSISVVEGNTRTTTEALFTFALSFATGRLVTANYATSNLTAFGSASCGNPGTDYETVAGTISFQPGATSVTVPVKVCGDTSAEENELIRFRLSNASNAVVFFNQALGTIINDDELELLLEDSGPAVNQAAALDALLFLRDPFRVVGIPEWFATSSDRNTRMMFFVRGLQLNPGEFPSAVIVRLTGSNQLFDVPAEDVRSVPNVDFTQLVIRLPDDLPVGTYTVTVRAHSRTSNAGTIRIAP